MMPGVGPVEETAAASATTAPPLQPEIAAKPAEGLCLPQAHKLPPLPPPAALKWVGDTAHYARLCMSVNKKEKYKRAAICLTGTSLFLTDPRGDVQVCLRLDRITELYEEDVMVKHSVVGHKHSEKHLLFKCAHGVDVLIALAHDKENSAQCGDDDLCVAYIKDALAAAGNPLEVQPVPSWKRIQALANHDPPDGYVRPQEFLAKTVKDAADKRDAGTPNRSFAVDNDADESERTPGAEAHAVQEAALQAQLDAALAQAAHHKEQADTLRADLAQERAVRDDMVRDLRSDFDAKFIKKQAEEFELRHRKHQRVRDKDEERIRELQQRLAEPKVYTGAPEHLARIEVLTDRVAALDALLDVERCKAIHFQNVADEQYLAALGCYEFVNNAALPRIRDLQAGKDYRVLPLLGKLPSAPVGVRGFVYKEGVRPVREGTTVGGGDATAVADIDLDDLGLDAALASPGGGGGAADIDLGSLGSPVHRDPAAEIDLDDLSLGGSPQRAGSPGGELDLDL